MQAHDLDIFDDVICTGPVPRGDLTLAPGASAWVVAIDTKAATFDAVVRGNPLIGIVMRLPVASFEIDRARGVFGDGD